MTRLSKDLHDRMKQFPFLESWSAEIIEQGDRPPIESMGKLWDERDRKNEIMRTKIKAALHTLNWLGYILDNDDGDNPGELTLVTAFFCKEG